MAFASKRFTLVDSMWTQICVAGCTNVTIENMDPLRQIRFIAGQTSPSLNITDYKTIRPNDAVSLVNMDDTTILWARAVEGTSVIEVITG